MTVMIHWKAVVLKYSEVSLELPSSCDSREVRWRTMREGEDGFGDDDNGGGAGSKIG